MVCDVNCDPVRVAAFDGENADPANGRATGDGVKARTPWGEIAYALAGREGYERVRESDELRMAPGAANLRELIGEQPALILRDNMRAVAERIENMGREEATYWLSMAMHRTHPRRVLTALRFLLTEPRRRASG